MGSRGKCGLGLSLFAVALLVGGCSQADNKGPAKEKAKASPVAQAKDKKDHDHSGWWCDEHGIPEAECSMCSARVAAEFKRKGDWCDKHDRAQSQCFLCDPKLKEKYAALYRAKYGKEPPPIEEDEKPKETKETKG